MTERRNATGIKSWPEDDRPREKLLKKGAGALSNSELLAILLRTGTELASFNHLPTSRKHELINKAAMKKWLSE